MEYGECDTGVHPKKFLAARRCGPYLALSVALPNTIACYSSD